MNEKEKNEINNKNDKMILEWYNNNEISRCNKNNSNKDKKKKIGKNMAAT